MKLHLFQRLRLATAVMLIIVVAVVHFVDRPLTRAAATLDPFRSFLTSAPVSLPVMIAFAMLGVAAGAFYLLRQKPVPKWATAGMLAGTALVWSFCLVDFVLKPLFGRAIPTAFLDSGVYGFFWFHQGDAFGSFPSGHSDQAGAILSVLWTYYPAWRWAFVAAFVALAAALIIGEWHYLGDVLAGGYIGAASGILITRVWNVLRPGGSRA